MITPPAKLGMLGGGQLGRYFVMAAHELGYRVIVLDPDPDSVAGRIADEHLIAAYDDENALLHLAACCQAVTTEFENVPASSLAWLEQRLPVRPGARIVEICQDRLLEKSFFSMQGLPHAPFAVIRSESEIMAADPGLFPGILKVSRFGYDGKGQIAVADREAALEAFLGFGGALCILERKLHLDGEVSMILARDAAGNCAAYPLVENRHRDGILDVSVVPASLSADLADELRSMAFGIAERLNYVGVLAIEFFIVGGKICLNELAPRPHNSGHFSLDACITSQFEQQVRAVCGLPLGSTELLSNAAMFNLLGDLWFDRDEAGEPDWARLLAEDGLKLHLYGKKKARPGRKMGHFTLLGSDCAELVSTGRRIRDSLA
jgi:5-(carboxyamino)imidazole ribonucleotide synthase